jgi:hypothetical protein
MRNCAIIHPLHLELETAPNFTHDPWFFSTDSSEIDIDSVGKHWE